jgi:FlaA1/EpsC-like NDP-sugar epimerase
MGDERGAERQPTTASRRAFLRTVGLTGLGALAAQWKPSPTYALAGGPQVVGANSRIGVGIIGCGSQGNAHIRTIQRLQQDGENIAIVAVCDVYQKRLDAAVQRTNAKPYRDYRELLHDPNVDAVFIVTPEHWHAQMAIDAMNASKAVYLESR